MANANKLYEEDIPLFDGLPQKRMWCSFSWNVQHQMGFVLLYNDSGLALIRVWQSTQTRLRYRLHVNVNAGVAYQPFGLWTAPLFCKFAKT